VLGSEGDCDFRLRCVEAPDGPPEALVAETGLSAEEWAAREEQQLAPRYGVDVGGGGREGGHRSVLVDRVIAHMDLLHAVKMGNAGGNFTSNLPLLVSIWVHFERLLVVTALRWFEEAKSDDVNTQVGRGGAGPLHYAVHHANLSFVRKVRMPQSHPI